MGIVIKDRIDFLHREIAIENNTLRDYVASFTDYPLIRSRVTDRIDPYMISDICVAVNLHRDTVDMIQHLTRRIFFDVPIENWGSISVLPDMITPFSSPVVVEDSDIDVSDSLYDVMNRLLKVNFTSRRVLVRNRPIRRNIDNLAEYSCSNPLPYASLLTPVINMLRAILPDYRQDSGSQLFNCPTRCIPCWKQLPYSEVVFLLNIVSWVTIGLYVPDIQTEFMKIVNEIYSEGLCIIQNFEINAVVRRVETSSEEDIDPIDLEPFNVGDDIFVLNCSHKLKSATLTSMITDQLNRHYNPYKDIICPLCRTVIGVYTRS
jgi:hypothetical protein